MGKYSDFAKRPHDEYLTPYRAVIPLIPHLKDVRTFAEPCRANGQLISHIEQHGPLCIHSGDIQDGTNALHDRELRQLVVDRIITNPPYTWQVLKEMLRLFPTIAPTWLLLEATFAYKDQAAPFMSICSEIVPIGSVKWFDGTKHNSVERYAWYQFDAKHSGPTVFHTKNKIPQQRRAAANQGA